VSDPSIRTNAHRPHIAIDARRLWGGGLATACVAALVAVAGVMICQYVLDISLVRPALLLDVADSFRLDYAITAFVLALVATGVAHGVAVATPRPRAFFGWIMGLATVCGAAAPFAIGNDLESQVATACINVALGICIWSLVASVMARTMTPAP
jgi:hypothetical protein